MSPRATPTTTNTNTNMTTEIKAVAKMLSNKVALLVAQGMPESEAFDAVMTRLETEYPKVFAVLILTARA